MIMEMMSFPLQFVLFVDLHRMPVCVKSEKEASILGAGTTATRSEHQYNCLTRIQDDVLIVASAKQDCVP
jgi:hypothetical protein